MYTGKWFDIIYRGIDYALFILIGRQTSVLLFPLDWIVHLVVEYQRTGESSLQLLVVLVALTDKFNALFHYGNFPVG